MVRRVCSYNTTFCFRDRFLYNGFCVDYYIEPLERGNSRHVILIINEANSQTFFLVGTEIIKSMNNCTAYIQTVLA